MAATTARPRREGPVQKFRHLAAVSHIIGGCGGILPTTLVKGETTDGILPSTSVKETSQELTNGGTLTHYVVEL